MARWKVTIRHGSEVARESFDDLEGAIELALRRTDEIRSQGHLEPVKSLRDFEPEQLVNARIEITGKGLFRPPTAGLDIMGDGSLVAFTGGVARKPLAGEGEREVFDAIRESLAR